MKNYNEIIHQAFQIIGISYFNGPLNIHTISTQYKAIKQVNLQYCFDCIIHLFIITSLPWEFIETLQ